VLGEVDRLLALAGTSKARLLTAQIWLSDMATFQEMNAVWDAWVDRANPPARWTGEAKLATPDYKVEIIVTAAVPEALIALAVAAPRRRSRCAAGMRRRGGRTFPLILFSPTEGGEPLHCIRHPRLDAFTPCAPQGGWGSARSGARSGA
jgi:hypothetical protein